MLVDSNETIFLEDKEYFYRTKLKIPIYSIFENYLVLSRTFDFV